MHRSPPWAKRRRGAGQRRAGDDLAAVYCSDLQRSWRTAEVAFARRGVPIPRRPAARMRLRDVDPPAASRDRDSPRRADRDRVSRAVKRARARHHSPRSETREHQGAARRDSESPRLRSGEGLGRGRRQASRRHRQFPDDHVPGHDDAGRDSWNGGLHVAGTGEGQARRQARRPLGVRVRRVRDAERARPFEGATIAEVLAKVIEREPDWHALPPTTPRSIRTLLRRCLAKDRKGRLDSAAGGRLEIDEASTTVRRRIRRERGRLEPKMASLGGCRLGARRHDRQRDRGVDGQPIAGTAVTGREPLHRDAAGGAGTRVQHQRSRRGDLTGRHAVAFTGGDDAQLVLRALDQLELRLAARHRQCARAVLLARWPVDWRLRSARRGRDHRPGCREYVTESLAAWRPAGDRGAAGRGVSRRQLGRGRFDRVCDQRSLDRAPAGGREWRRARGADQARPGEGRDRPFLSLTAAGRPRHPVHDHRPLWRPRFGRVRSGESPAENAASIRSPGAVRRHGPPRVRGCWRVVGRRIRSGDALGRRQSGADRRSGVDAGRDGVCLVAHRDLGLCPGEQRQGEPTGVGQPARRHLPVTAASAPAQTPTTLSRRHANRGSDSARDGRGLDWRQRTAGG